LIPLIEFGFVHFERRKPVMTAASLRNTGISLIGEVEGAPARLRLKQAAN
jgi:hypothetical protein